MVFQEKSIRKAFFGRRTQECTLKFEMVKHVFDMLPRPVNAILELVLMLVAAQQAYHHAAAVMSQGNPAYLLRECVRVPSA